MWAPHQAFVRKAVFKAASFPRTATCRRRTSPFHVGKYQERTSITLWHFIKSFVLLFKKLFCIRPSVRPSVRMAAKRPRQCAREGAWRGEREGGREEEEEEEEEEKEKRELGKPALRDDNARTLL